MVWIAFMCHMPATKFVPSHFEHKIQVLLQVWNVLQWWSTRIPNLNAQGYKPSCWPNSIDTYISKHCRPNTRPKHCTNGQTIFKKIKQKVKTVFSLPRQFKAFDCFQHIASIPRNTLQSKTSLKAQEHVLHRPTVCQIFS